MGPYSPKIKRDGREETDTRWECGLNEKMVRIDSSRLWDDNEGHQTG